MKDRKGVIFSLLLLIWVQSAFACSCFGVGEVKESLNFADIVFKGQVIEKTLIRLDTSSAYSSFTNWQIRFRTKTIYSGKRKLREAEIVVVTGIGGGDCGFGFELGEEYVVYAGFSNYVYKRPFKYLETNICTRTTYNTEKEEKEIAKVQRPRRWKQYASQSPSFEFNNIALLKFLRESGYPFSNWKMISIHQQPLMKKLESQDFFSFSLSDAYILRSEAKMEEVTLDLTYIDFVSLDVAAKVFEKVNDLISKKAIFEKPPKQFFLMGDKIVIFSVRSFNDRFVNKALFDIVLKDFFPKDYDPKACRCRI